MTEDIPHAALQARQLYAESVPVSRILAETGLTLNRLYYWLSGGGGRLHPVPRRHVFGVRGPEGGRRAMIGRMMRAADYKMRQIEARMHSAGLQAPEQNRDMRDFASLARVMRDLTAIEGPRRKPTSDRPDEPAPRDENELRESLLHKLEALADREETQIPPGPDKG